MATITRWEPFTEMTSLRDAMNHLLAESFVRPGRIQGAGNSWVPMDVYENEHGYVVKLAIPGLKAEDFDISLHENVLTVRGKTQSPESQEGMTYHLREWRSGEFSRSVQFPTAVDEEKIEAQLVDGVLTINLPKSAKAMPRRITVNVS